MIIFLNFNLPHVYGQCLEKTPFMNGRLPNYSHGLQTWLERCGIACEIDTINFVNV
jgi:hypothetical protein